jgi:hypothetical protein
MPIPIATLGPANKRPANKEVPQSAITPSNAAFFMISSFLASRLLVLAADAL